MHVIFTGTVQGVGFRYATEKLARRFPVKGFVRNLTQGRVEVVAEGEEKLLEEFLGVMREDWRSFIQDADVTWGEATDEFNRFGIKF